MTPFTASLDHGKWRGGLAASLLFHAGLAGFALFAIRFAEAPPLPAPIMVELISLAESEQTIPSPKEAPAARQVMPVAKKAPAPAKPTPAQDPLPSATKDVLQETAVSSAEERAAAPFVAAAADASSQTVGAKGETGATGPDYRAAYLSNPPPAYPLAARKRGLEGVVILKADVDPAGQPQSVAVHKSSGVEMFDNAALDAVRRWRFAPARRLGMAISASVLIPIRFQLGNAFLADAR